MRKKYLVRLFSSEKVGLTFLCFLIISLCYGQHQVTHNSWINVKKFGAKGDGKTNDTIAIQKALSLVPANGTLYFLLAFIEEL